MGYNAGSTGTVTVTGVGSRWTNSMWLFVGEAGVGTLHIDAGGQVSSTSGGYLGYNRAGSSGTVTVSGAGSTWTSGSDICVGRSGSGTLSIESGARVSSDNSFVADQPGSTGRVTVSGANATWANTLGLYIGASGDGALAIAAGGQVTSASGSVGDKTGSVGTVTVSGPGSKWTSGNSITIGSAGAGTLTIAGGGQISSLYGHIGSKSGSTGSATVSGTGSKWTSSNLYVGNSGNGVLTIEAGGQVSSVNGYLGDKSGSIGMATVSGSGSRWTSSGELLVGGSGSGKLTVADGGVVTARTLFASPADLSGNGTITANGAVLDADLVFDAVHAPSQAMSFGSGGTLSLAVNGTGNLGAGHKGNGTLRIADGVAIASNNGYLGNAAGSTGAAIVTGSGSKWANSSRLYVGSSGSGTLAIEAGGQVLSYTGYLGYAAGSAGTATVSGAGSAWINNSALYVGLGGRGSLTVTQGGLVTASTLFASLSNLAGNGTITANGAVLDGALIFDQSHGSKQMLAFGSGGTLTLTLNGIGALGAGHQGSGNLRITDGIEVRSAYGQLGSSSTASGMALVSGAGSKWSNSGSLYVGFSGTGGLTIEDAGEVSSAGGYVGHEGTSAGTVVVRGASSIWSCSTRLQVGSYGTGTLIVEDSAQVSNAGYMMSYLGYYEKSAGAATVIGTGSKWATGSLEVGHGGRGTLTVADGGLVTGTTLTINSQSAVRLQVSGDGMVVLGDAKMFGSVSNKGTISFCADALLPAGTYRPISAYPGQTVSWTGGGSYKAFGGIWSTSAKTFTVVESPALSAGESDAVTTGERMRFTDDLIGQRMGASFGNITGSVNFSAAPMSEDDLAGLAEMLEEGRGVLSAWDFTTNFSGGEAMLSFDIGTGAEELAVWRYSGGAWSEFAPSLFTYDSNGIASFTVSSFSGYAVTAAVPEPGVMGLLALGGAMLLIRRWPRG